MSELEKEGPGLEAAWTTARRMADPSWRVERADEVHIGDVVRLVPSAEAPIPPGAGDDEEIGVTEWDGSFGLASITLSALLAEITVVYAGDYPILVRVEEEFVPTPPELYQ